MGSYCTISRNPTERAILFRSLWLTDIWSFGESVFFLIPQFTHDTVSFTILYESNASYCISY